MKLRDVVLAGQKSQAARLDALSSTLGRPEPEYGRARPGRYQADSPKQSAKAYAGGRDGIDHFYDAVNVYLKQAAKAELRFRDDQGRTVRVEKGPDDPADIREVPADLHELLTWPNPWQPWSELFSLMIIDLLSVGNFVGVKQGADQDGNKPASVYRLPVVDVEVESTKARHINRYVYTGGRRPQFFDPQQVIHLRLPNPHSPYSMWGKGAVQAAPQPFDVELGLVEAQRNYFAEGTVLGGVLESDRTIPEATRRKALHEFLNLHRGSRQWGKLAFLERGMRYRAIQSNARDAGYDTLSKMSRERIFAMLLTPMILAGIGFNESQKGTLDDARRYFSDDVMRPFLDALAPVITQQLTGAWGLRAEFNYAYVPPAEQRIKNATEIATLPGFRVREIREAAGYPPLGPDFKDELTGEPIDDLVLNVPGPSTEGSLGAPDATMGPEGGRPADPTNVERFGSRASQLVNNRPASAADVARRARTRAPAIAGKSGMSPEEILAWRP